MAGIGSGRSHHVGAAGKVEDWRAIDLADLKRMGLLKPRVPKAYPDPLWGQHLAVPAVPTIEVCIPIGGIELAGTTQGA